MGSSAKDPGRRGESPAASSNSSSGRSGAELSVLAIDHSKSMGWDDFPPSRLDAALGAAAAFMQVKAAEFPDDCIGVVVFHREGSDAMAPAPAKEAPKRWKKCARKVKPFDGTYLEAGLRTAAEMLGTHSTQTAWGVRRIVLLTDGHGGNPIEYADELKKQGIVLDVIGIGGTPEDVAEPILKEVASVVGTDLRYRFITDADSLFEHFKRIATGLVK